MLFHFDFYSSILLIFFVHAVVYCILLFQKAVLKESKPEIYLAFILLLCALYICPWMLGFAGWYWDGNRFYKNILFYFPFQQMLFIGPLIYFYVQSLLNPAFRFNRKMRLHLIPGMLYFGYVLWMFVYDQLILNKVFFYADGNDRDFDSWYELVCTVSVSAYLFLTFRFYNRYRKIIFHLSSNAYTIQYQWVRNFLIAFFIYIILFSAFSLYSTLIKELSYKEFWWYYLIFAITVYYIAINGYSNAIANKVPFQLVANHHKIQLELGYESKQKELVIEDIEHLEITEPGTTDTSINNWKTTIQNAMVQQKLYENPELNLPDLAKKLHTNPSVLSRAINKGFGQNFNDLINHYRIDAVVSLLKTGEQKRQTLLGIAYDCGFNSKATFNRAFKKRFEMSPKEWLEKERDS